MRKLNECKEYFKDLYIDCLASNAFGKSKFESPDIARYEMFCETIEFVYGTDFKQIKPIWSQEASNEFYSNKTAQPKRWNFSTVRRNCPTCADDGRAHDERMVDNMTKADLMKEFERLQEEKKCRIEGIYWNSRKDEIQNAINCLNCPDDMLEKYLMVVSLKYENIGRTIANNGDFKHHSHNRLYVYNTARMILA